MSSNRCLELETLMRREYSLPAAAPFQGFHILYMGAVQDEAFCIEYNATDEVNLRVICIKLFYALPRHLSEPFDKIAWEEISSMLKYVPHLQNLNTDDNTRRDFAAARLTAMLGPITRTATKLFAFFRSRPDFPSFATLQAIPADRLASTWASRFGLDELLADADTLGGIPPSITVKGIEMTTMNARWLAHSVREFVRAGAQNSSRIDAELTAEWWPTLLNGIIKNPGTP